MSLIKKLIMDTIAMAKYLLTAAVLYFLQQLGELLALHSL